MKKIISSVLLFVLFWGISVQTSEAAGSDKFKVISAKIYELKKLPDGSVRIMFETVVKNESKESKDVKMKHKFMDAKVGQMSNITTDDIKINSEGSGCSIWNYDREVFGVKAVQSWCGPLRVRPGTTAKFYETYRIASDYIQRNVSENKDTFVVTSRFLATIPQEQDVFPKQAWKINFKKMTSKPIGFIEN